MTKFWYLYKKYYKLWSSVTYNSMIEMCSWRTTHRLVSAWCYCSIRIAFLPTSAYTVFNTFHNLRWLTHLWLFTQFSPYFPVYHCTLSSLSLSHSHTQSKRSVFSVRFRMFSYWLGKSILYTFVYSVIQSTPRLVTSNGWYSTAAPSIIPTF